MSPPCRESTELDGIRRTHQHPCTRQSPDGELWRTSSEYYAWVYTGDWEWRPCLSKSHKALDNGNSLPAHPDLLCSQAAHRESSLCYQNPDMSALQKVGNIKRSVFSHGSAMSCQISVPTAFGSKSCTVHSRRTGALHSSWATSKSKARCDCPGSWADDLEWITQRSS